ncbi:MarR family transcriptional regulator [Mesorhizobium sp. Z1-4]|uniref:MarR family winged helix-turn-helix transcriptional regulator n=1 Tax=Mesorhizobium sp. Z1-4 TaxID=2448478 RepID=UPI000FD70ADD|nr:MarR family transcriptional regulator [Mesorhizobium sp. Z1-4]
MHRAIDPHSFGFLLTDLARLFRADFDRRVSESGLGLTAGEARTLAHIARAEGERQSVIAERLNVEAMTLSAMIDRLEARGLVKRKRDPADRRAKCISLTPLADETLMRVTALAGEISAEASRGIGKADWAAASEVLRQAHLNMMEVRARAAATDDAA